MKWAMVLILAVGITLGACGDVGDTERMLHLGDRDVTASEFRKMTRESLEAGAEGVDTEIVCAAVIGLSDQGVLKILADSRQDLSPDPSSEDWLKAAAIFREECERIS